MKKQSLIGISLLGGMLLIAGCSSGDEDNILDQQLQETLNNAAPTKDFSYFKLPNSDDFSNIPQDPRNPLNAAKVALGKMLFHETGLAINPHMPEGKETYSCSSCHHAPAGFQAGIKQGIGEGGVGFGSAGEGRHNKNSYPFGELDVQPIRTPSAMNSAYQEVQLWNGQFGATGMNIGTNAQWTPASPIANNNLGYHGVETQAIAGLSVHRMKVSETLIQRGYKAMFDAAFPDTPEADRYGLETTGLAIAAYERTLLSNEAPFQEWLKGATNALTDREKSGAILFFGKAGCVSCHTGPALNTMEFYALGMDDLAGDGVYGTEGAGAENAKRGRGGFTGKTEDMYKFKVPQLYSLAYSPFYGHGGNFTSIEEVVNYKNRAIPQNTNVPTSQLAGEFQPLGLTSEEVQDIVAFVKNGLNDKNLLRYEPSAVLSGNCFPNNDAESRQDRGCN